MRFIGFRLVITVCAMVVVGCTPGGQAGSQAGAERPAQPKRLTVATIQTPLSLSVKLGGTQVRVVEALISAGAVRFTPAGEGTPLLAEAVPTVENGLWKVFPDGRMETTWTLKAGLTWHDGRPLTTDDLLFGAQVSQDRDLPDFGHDAFGSLETVRAVDARTITAEWKRPYVEADKLFSWEVGLPLPRHLLEESYLSSKQTFPGHRYWTTDEFVHAGPFRVREFVLNERLVLDAFPGFVLGRPNIDTVEVRFIPDPNTLVANVLAGAADFTIGYELSVGQARQAAEQWPQGAMATYPLQSVTSAQPQFVNPDPPVLLDVRFRRALVHAFDKEALNELINYGLTPPPSGFPVSVGAPEFSDLKPSIVEYPFDPRRAAQLIEEIGYTRAGDGYRDATGKELTIEFRTSSVPSPTHQAVLFVVDSWKRVGLQPILNTGRFDQESAATRPAFTSGRGTFSIVEPRRMERYFHSRNIPTAQNRWSGSNAARYANPELDALIDRFFLTVPHQERLDVFKQIAQHITSNVAVIIMAHELNAALISSRVKDVTPGTTYTYTWDPHKWDIQ